MIQLFQLLLLVQPVRTEYRSSNCHLAKIQCKFVRCINYFHIILETLCFQIGGTDAVYRVVIDPPGVVVADVGAETCTGEMCHYIYSSNTLTNSSTVSVDVVGCVTERMDATNMSTCKIISNCGCSN